MNLVRCKQQIKALYDAQPSLRYDYPKLTRQARGENKEYCLTEFDWISQVDRYLLWISDVNWDDNSDTAIEKETTGDTVVFSGTKEHNAAGVVEQVISRDWVTEIREEGWGYLSSIGYILLVAFVGLFFIAILKYLLEFLYDVFNARRLIFMRVMQPRGDSKLDREREKELAKDMKEKIWRMSQVFRGLHKLGKLSVIDNLLRRLFDKPKVTLLLHYEDAKLSFIIGTYPEYKSIVESAIGAQYSEASLEIIKKPRLFNKKHIEIMPLEPVKPSYYPIRTFKQLEDDPLNNVIDSMGKIAPEDTFTVMLTIKPEWDAFNRTAQKMADALYRKDEAITKSKPLWKRLMPRNLFSFLIFWPSQALIQRFTTKEKQWDPLIRMVKAEEEALNIMAEEAWKQAYEAGLLLISWSDDAKKAEENIYNVVSAYTIYKDEYNNELDQPETIADLFWRLLGPFRRFAVAFYLSSFFFRKNVFTVNSLSSLFHLPDALYNRSPIISRMDYKVLASPDDVPTLEKETWYIISGIIADTYQDGKLSNILAELKHPSIGSKVETVTKKTEVAADYVAKEGEEVLEEDGKKYLVHTSEKKIYGFKTYKDGILLGVNIYRNMYTPIYMKKKDRTRHHYIIWKSGTGKSVFIDMLARQDIWAWDGCCVIDPHGDLVESVLQYIPKERAKDVIYFDAGNEERPMGLNMYEISNSSEADRAVNDATEIFLKMFGPEIFGPRIQEYFKYGSLTLLDDLEEWATLLDVPRLFTDDTYREYKTKRVQNPVVRNFREKTYNAMGDREKQEIIPYFTSKFVSFNTNSLIRNIIGQTKSAFNFREVMDNQKILLINLSKGKIGELNAQLLGMILVSKIYNAAMGRANIDEKDRKDFYLYVDEFQNFVTNTFADILSEARKYKLALIMAHQYIAQLDWWGGNNIGESGGGKKSVKDAVFGNVGTMQSFKVGAPDAEFLEKEYAPVLSSQDILGIANYKTYVKLNINNTTSRVFSMNSLWTEDYKNEKVADILKQYSEKKYGRKKEYVEAEITARLGMMWTEEWEKTAEQIAAESAASPAEWNAPDAVAGGDTSSVLPESTWVLPQNSGTAPIETESNDQSNSQQA